MQDDWTKIQPLSHNEALIAVEKYFNSCTYSPSRIDHTKNKDNEESPDLILREEDGEVLFCEVKAPGHYFNPIIRMYLWEDVYNRLRDRLRKARSQLENYDPEHRIPRVVAITSNHPQLNYTSCQHNLLGKVQFQDQILQDFTTRNEYKYTIKNKSMIDMILWCQVNRYTNEIFETEQFINLQSKHIEKLKEISNTLNVNRRYVFCYILG